MNIGIYLKWEIGSLERSTGNVLGDELYAKSLVKALNAYSAAIEAAIYHPGKEPNKKLDVMLYFNDTPPNKSWANKSVLYLQNGYGEGSDEKLSELRAYLYDGYAFISHRLLELHQQDGFQGLFLPFGVDTEFFKPSPMNADLAFDVAYIGNDIKGKERSEAYLEPALHFNFGLFGNWNFPKARIRIWKNWFQPSYRKVFEKISLGKIPQENVPVLYSSSQINLNCTIQDCVCWDVITLRALEVLACNGFLITDRVPSAERLFSDYVVFTDGHEDLKEKISYYLHHPQERKKMAIAGGKYVRENFSIQASVDKLLKYIKDI